MRLITNTNIIVDDFDYCKFYPKNSFVHFLSHFHQDHWGGLSPLWDYGPIYCSEESKKLIVNRFPKVEPFVNALELKKPIKLCLNNDPDLEVEVTFFDAHHIPGSVMILFQGYMGTILHTGDFRYCPQMIEENPVLFPPELRKSGNRLGVSIPIDEMIFDNTYCNPMFDFPVADMAYRQMEKIIEKNMGKKVFIAMSALGKEEICIRLAERFQTLIVLTEEKYRNMVVLNIRPEVFTTDQAEGWIEIISKKVRKERLSEEAKNSGKNFICISIDFLMMEHRDPDGINYMVPFSLHSNYPEMESLIKAIKPCILKKLVLPYENLPQFRMLPINNIKVYSAYLKHLKENGKSAYSELKRLFTDIFKLSDNYKRWMNEEAQASLIKRLALDRKPDMALRKRKVNIEARSFERLPHEEKKLTLGDIADNLKATHNNINIKEYLTKEGESECRKPAEGPAGGETKEFIEGKKIESAEMPKSLQQSKIRKLEGKDSKSLKRVYEKKEGESSFKLVKKTFKPNPAKTEVDDKILLKERIENEEFSKKLENLLTSFINT